jgi:hypothetical protein
MKAKTRKILKRICYWMFHKHQARIEFGINDGWYRYVAGFTSREEGRDGILAIKRSKKPITKENIMQIHKFFSTDVQILLKFNHKKDVEVLIQQLILIKNTLNQ